MSAGNLYFRVPTTLVSDARVLEAGTAAFGLHLAAWSYCGHHLTDGHLPRVALRAVFPGASLRHLLHLAKRLETCGLWTPQASGWCISGFAAVNLSRAEVQQRSSVNAVNGRLGGRPRGRSTTLLSKTDEAESDSVSDLRSATETLTEQNRTPPHTHNTAPDGATGARARVDDPLQTAVASAFEAFWAEYPVKQGQSEAWRAYLQLRPDVATQAAILRGLRAAKDAGRWWCDGTRVAGLSAARWLTERCWMEPQGFVEPVDPRVERERRDAALLLAKMRQENAERKARMHGESAEAVSHG